MVDDLQPVHHREVMDRDMLELWSRAKPLPPEIRLYGGTALGLYIGHRRSFDFDFVHVEGGVTLEFVATHMAPFNEGEVVGGPGMVDVLWQGSEREVQINFAECGSAFVPYPTQKPVYAPNGVAVAHPDDLVAAKLRALANRDVPRDYIDIAHCIRRLPASLAIAYDILDAQRDDLHRIAKAMSSPGKEARAYCPAADLRVVADFAGDMVAGYHDRQRRPHGTPWQSK